MPETGSELPVIYWVTDPNPARHEQSAFFHHWQIKNGHGQAITLSTAGEVERFQARRWTDRLITAMREQNPDGVKVWDESLEPIPVDGAALPIEVFVPAVELRLDFSNSDNTKKVIQGVSGVGSAIFDQTSNTLHFGQAVGILADVTDKAKELGFDVSTTYPEIVPDLTVDGRQYAYPCNVSVGQYFVNKATFARYGLPTPPRHWDTETYERIGKQLVDAANEAGERRTVFFADDISTIHMHRSKGLSSFNETLTRCTINDRRYVEALKLKHKWMYEDHLIPTLAERAGFDVEAGFGGPRLQLFSRGNYAMIGGGRWLLIQLRKFGAMDLSVSGFPRFRGGMPNTTFYTRCAAVYRGTKQAYGGDTFDEAVLFLAYLASEDYNLQIVRDADALPPNPKYADSEAFRNPADYPNEHGVHQPWHDAALHLAIAQPASPYVIKAVSQRHLREAEDAFMNDRMSAERAAAQAAERINAEIQRTLDEQPNLREGYDRRLERQAKIDALRAANKPVPVEWIDNPFHRKWYAHNGWLVEGGGG